MMADYCWDIMRDNVSSVHKRRSKKTRFVPEQQEEVEVTYFSI